MIIKKLMQKQWSTFSYFIFPIIWMTIIYFLSAQPILPGVDVFWLDFIFKKSAHLTVYMILFWSWFFAFRLSKSKPEKTFKIVLLILSLCLVFAFLDELHQSFVPGRTGTIRDVGYDFLGVSLAALWTCRLI